MPHLTPQDMAKAAGEIKLWLREKLKDPATVQTIPPDMRDGMAVFQSALNLLEIGKGKDLLGPVHSKILGDIIKNYGDAYPWLHELAEKCAEADLYDPSKQAGRSI